MPCVVDVGKRLEKYVSGNKCEAARVNTMTGGLDLSLASPEMVRFPTPIR